MRRVVHHPEFILFSSGYEDRLTSDETLEALEGELAELGLEFAFVWSRQEWAGAGETLFGDTATRLWSRGIIDALSQELAEQPELASRADIVACFRARSPERQLDDSHVDALYHALHGADYCSMYGHEVQWWDLDTTGQRFVIVFGDAESG